MVFVSLIISIAFATPPAWADLRCEILDLGTIINPGTLNNDTYAISINDLGQVVGISGMAAFLWDSNNGMTHITVDMEPINIHVSQINNAGQIAGTFGLWENGKTNDLGIGFEPWGLGPRCTGINDSSQVVGTRFIPGDVVIKLPNGEGPIKYSDNIPEDAIIRYEIPRTVAFIWDPVHGAKDIEVLCNESDWPSAINNAGQVTGSWSNDSDPNDHGHAFVWDSNTNEMINLGMLGFETSTATDINNNGQVVGYLCWLNFRDAWNSTHAFFWDESEGMIDIGTLSGDFAEATAINDAGQVVGCSGENAGDCRAFLWSKDLGMVDLTELLPVNSKWDYLVFASDINNHGQIVGEGITTNGQRRAFLMNLVIDPIDVALLNIQDAIDEKLEALENLNASLQNERMALAVLSEMLEAKDYNGLRRLDLIRARIRTVRSLIRELKVKRELKKSIRDLRMALEHLSSPEPE